MKMFHGRVAWWTAALIMAGASEAAAQAAPAVGDAPLSISAQVSLAALQSTLRRAIGKGASLSGSDRGTHPSGQGGYGIRYRVDVGNLRVSAGDDGTLAIEVPVSLSPSGGRKLVWLSPLAGVAIETLGCGPMVVNTLTRVTLAVRDGRLSSSVHADDARSANCVIRRKRNVLRGIGPDLTWHAHETLRETAAKRVSGAIAAALNADRLAALVSGYQEQAVARFSRPFDLPLADTALKLHIGKDISLGTVAVLPTALQIDLLAAVSPEIVFDGQPRSSTRAETPKRGFRVPIELVIPLRALPPSADGSGLEMKLPGSTAMLNLARVPAQADLVRLGVVGGQGVDSLIYFALRDDARASAAPAEFALDGTLDELLRQAGAWLGEASNWPEAARADAAELGRQVGDFRRVVESALGSLGDITLQPGLSFSLRQPQIMLGAGRYEKEMIRVPAELSGFAKVELTIQ